jgi:hypothetical protein
MASRFSCPEANEVEALAIGARLALSSLETDSAASALARAAIKMKLYAIHGLNCRVFIGSILINLINYSSKFGEMWGTLKIQSV